MFFAFIFALLIPVFATENPKSGIEESIQSLELRKDYETTGRFIRSIVEAHEKAFPGALKHVHLQYYTPLKRLSFVQQGLVASINKTPQALELFKKRPPMADITVTVEKPFSTDSSKLNTLRWNTIKKEVALRVRYESGWNHKVEKSFEAFKKSWLNESERLLNPTFTKMFARKYAVQYVLFATILKQNPDFKIDDLAEKIESLEVGALDYLVDEKHYMPILDYLSPSSKKLKESRAEIKRQMQKAHSDIIDDIYSNGLKIELNVGDQITIREVHPNIAILRGYVGNDCSTSFSPGFVFTPYDRYFYAFDAENNVLGYVGISMVKIKKENAVFLHTIQGPDFNEASTQLVMRGLQQSLSAFNATRIVLAQDYNIGSNVNYEPIRRAMMNAVANTPTQDVQWLDKEFREYIAFWDSTMTYDDPDKNKLGRELNFDNSIVKVEIQQTPFKVEFNEPPTKDLKALHCELRLISRSSYYGGDY